MYNPAHFEETRSEVLHALVASHSLGTLVTLNAGGLDANHIPFELAPADGPLGTLRAHVARANPVWKSHAAGLEVLVIFQGPQAYITPSWYRETKPATGKVVPTWNYCVVHAHGPMRIIEDRAWLRVQINRLVQRHEGGRAQPWHVTDAPEDFIEQQLAAIVGLEIAIQRIAGKWKVSQNRPPADREGVADGLRQEPHAGAAAMAELVRAHSRGPAA
jgi:transcriptional regulator